MSRLIVSVALVVGVGCGGAGPNEIVSSRKLSGASGAPKISGVADMGDFGAIPRQGSLPKADSDGDYVVGEIIVIRGSNFGKQPTINIGGRPAEPLARTGSGAIITRIPAGVPTGKIDVEVSHPGGRNSVDIVVRRHAFVVQPGADKLFVLDMAANGAVATGGDIAIPGASRVTVSHDGQVALVAATDKGKARVGVVVTTASAGPRLVRTLELEGRAATFIDAAPDAPVGAVVGGGMLTMLDLDDARNPAAYPGVDLGEYGNDIVEIAMSPTGDLLVLLLANANAVVPIDVSNRSAPRIGAPVALMPEERVPLVRDLGFAPDGAELWVVAGDNLEAIVAGTHPTQLIIISLTGATLSVERTVEVVGAPAPRSLAVARRESILGGTAIRSMSRRAAIAVAGVDRELFSIDPSDPGGAATLVQAQLGQLVRTDLDGEGEAIWSSASVTTDIMLSQDVKYVAAATTMVSGDASSVTLKFGVAITPIVGGETRFVELAAATLDALLAPASIALMP